MSGESKTSLPTSENLKGEFITNWNSSLLNVDKEQTRYIEMLNADKKYKNMSETEKTLYILNRWSPETKLWLTFVINAQLIAQNSPTYTPETFLKFVFNSVIEKEYERFKQSLLNIYIIYIKGNDDDETKIKKAAMFVFNQGTDIATLNSFDIARLNSLFSIVRPGNSNTGDIARLNSLFSTVRPGNSNTGLRLRL